MCNAVSDVNKFLCRTCLLMFTPRFSGEYAPLKIEFEILRSAMSAIGLTEDDDNHVSALRNTKFSVKNSTLLLYFNFCFALSVHHTK